MPCILLKALTNAAVRYDTFLSRAVRTTSSKPLQMVSSNPL